MLTFANVVHFFANEFAGLSARGFALLAVASSTFQSSFFGHNYPLFGTDLIANAAQTAPDTFAELIWAVRFRKPYARAEAVVVLTRA